MQTAALGINQHDINILHILSFLLCAFGVCYNPHSFGYTVHELIEIYVIIKQTIWPNYGSLLLYCSFSNKITNFYDFEDC